MDFQGTWETMVLSLLAFLPKLIVALITFVLGLIAAGPAARWTKVHAAKKIDNEDIVQLLCRLTRIAVIVITSIVALEQVNFNVTGFLAGLGVAGLTIGFALQDITKNFVAGVLLLIRQPFRVGNAVSIAGHAGTVQQINTRDTVLRTWDGEVVILPNIEVFTKPIINYTQARRRRRTIMIGLGYGQDARRAMALFEETLRNLPGVLPEPAPTLQAEALGDSAITLAARFWVDPHASDPFEVHSNAILALDAAAEREGIELPYPIQEVIWKPPDRDEVQA